MIAAAVFSAMLLIAACSSAPAPSVESQWQPLVEPNRWQQVRVESPWIEEAGKVLPCDAELGIAAEILNLELVFSVMTQFCPYVTVQQPLLHAVGEGDTIRLRFWHSELTAPADSTANVAVLIAQQLIWGEQFLIPMQGEYLDLEIPVEQSFAQDQPVWLHVDNHGANEYSLIELSAR